MHIHIMPAQGHVGIDGVAFPLDLSSLNDHPLVQDKAITLITFDGRDGEIQRASKVPGKINIEHFGQDEAAQLEPFIALWKAEDERRRLETEERRKVNAANLKAAEEAQAKAAAKQAAWEAAAPLRAVIEEIEQRFKRSDEIAVRCAKAKIDYPQAWQDYDTALRAIRNQAEAKDFDPASVVWPDEPEKPKLP